MAKRGLKANKTKLKIVKFKLSFCFFALAQ